MWPKEGFVQSPFVLISSCLSLSQNQNQNKFNIPSGCVRLAGCRKQQRLILVYLIHSVRRLLGCSLVEKPSSSADLTCGKTVCTDGPVYRCKRSQVQVLFFSGPTKPPVIKRLCIRLGTIFRHLHRLIITHHAIITNTTLFGPLLTCWREEFTLTVFFNTCSDLLKLSCPVSSAWQDEFLMTHVWMFIRK